MYKRIKNIMDACEHIAECYAVIEKADTDFNGASFRHPTRIKHEGDVAVEVGRGMKHIMEFFNVQGQSRYSGYFHWGGLCFWSDIVGTPIFTLDSEKMLNTVNAYITMTNHIKQSIGDIIINCVSLYKETGINVVVGRTVNEGKVRLSVYCKSKEFIQYMVECYDAKEVDGKYYVDNVVIENRDREYSGC